MRFFIFAGMWLLVQFQLFAQVLAKDTSRMSLADAEKVFLSNNLELLAGKYGISSAQALIRQSGLWDNPSLYLEQNIYNSNNKKYFDAGGSGENIAQIQQLVLLAGKRNKKVRLAQSNSRISEFQFYDLLRTLKYELRTTFYETYFTFLILNTYDRELVTLRKNVAIFDTLNTKGIISLKEDIRLKAFLFTLENERLELLQNLYANQTTLNLLLNDSSIKFILPVLPPNLEDSLAKKIVSKEEMLAAALQNRADLKLYKENLNYERLNLNYQRALSVPDLRIGATYDRQGNFIRNYTALSLQMDLPTWNRNQGNIVAARFRVDQSKAHADLYTQQVKVEVNNVFDRNQQVLSLYQGFDKKFAQRFDQLTEGVLKNYQKRNITLLEFIDFYESYKDGIKQMNRLKQNIINSGEEINFVSGTDLIK